MCTLHLEVWSRCFYSSCSSEEDVLGFVIVFQTVIATEMLYIMCHAKVLQHNWTTLYSAVDMQFPRPSHFYRSGCGSQDYVQTLEPTMFARQHERILFSTRNWSMPSSPSCHCCPVTLTTTICKVIQIRRWRSLLVKWHLFFSRWNYVHFTGKNHVLI